MFKYTMLTALLAVAFTMNVCAADIQVPEGQPPMAGADPSIAANVYESYRYESLDIDKGVEKFRADATPTVMSTVKRGLRTQEEAARYLNRNADYIRRQIGPSTVFIFEENGQHTRFSMPLLSINNVKSYDAHGREPTYYIKSTNADIVVDSLPNNTYDDHKIMYKTIVNGQWNQDKGITTSGDKNYVRVKSTVEFSLPSDPSHVYRIGILTANPIKTAYVDKALANYVIPSVEDTRNVNAFSKEERWGNFKYRIVKHKKLDKSTYITERNEEVRLYESDNFIEQVTRRLLVDMDESTLFMGAFHQMDAKRKNYPLAYEEYATVWHDGVAGFIGVNIFKNGLYYINFVTRDDSYVYSVDIACKDDKEIKQSYREIRNMVELSTVIQKPHIEEYKVFNRVPEVTFLALP